MREGEEKRGKNRENRERKGGGKSTLKEVITPGRSVFGDSISIDNRESRP